MAKAIHMMVRVLDLDRLARFLSRPRFGLDVADRFDFDSFTLVYLRNAEADFEVELTLNKGRTEPYSAWRRLWPCRLRGRRSRRRARAPATAGLEPAADQGVLPRRRR